MALYAGTVVPAPAASNDPFIGMALYDPTIRVTHRMFLSDLYATFVGQHCTFQMFTFKRFLEDSTHVIAQFLTPRPECWFDLSIQRQFHQFQQHQAKYMGTSVDMPLAPPASSKRPAATSQAAEPNKRLKKLTAREKTLKQLLLTVMISKSKETRVGVALFANGDPCVELSSPKRGFDEIELKFAFDNEGYIKVYFQKRGIYLIFSSEATCKECARQVLRGII